MPSPGNKQISYVSLRDTAFSDEDDDDVDGGGVHVVVVEGLWNAGRVVEEVKDGRNP